MQNSAALVCDIERSKTGNTCLQFSDFGAKEHFPGETASTATLASKILIHSHRLEYWWATVLKYLLKTGCKS